MIYVNVNFDFFDEMADNYFQKEFGQGVFLAGIAMGMLAKEQVGEGEDVSEAPLYKQLRLGQMETRTLLKYLGMAPALARAYNVPHLKQIDAVIVEAMRRISRGGTEKMGVQGNYAFAFGFIDAPFWFYNHILQRQNAKQAELPIEQEDKTQDQEELQ